MTPILRRRPYREIIPLLMTLAVLLSACFPGISPAQEPGDQVLEIVATTTFVGEAVARIAGPGPHLTVMLGPGQNPHAYQPSPGDMVRISDADLLFSNGFGLEEFLGDLLAGADFGGVVVEVSEGIEPLVLEAEAPDGEDHASEGEAIDPHVWLDPMNWIVWTDNILSALVEIDPDHADLYRQNAAAYQAELRELDSWIRDQVDAIPAQDRALVTDHTSFGYFAAEYGFRQVGAVIPASTTEAETSGQQLAALLETIRENDVKAIFVSADIDPSLAAVVAADAGVELVPLYFGSLTDGGPADTYADFMRYNVNAIVGALGK